MAYFRNSTTWVIDFRYDGRPRRWFKVFGEGLDPTRQVREELQVLYGDRVQWVGARPATAEEESQFLRGEEVKNVHCPTGRTGVASSGDAAGTASRVEETRAGVDLPTNDP